MPLTRTRPVCALLAAAFAALAVATASADPVAGREFAFTQPDGQSVATRVWGDEFYIVVESLEGYTLTHDAATGYLCYAALAPDGAALVSTGIPAGACAAPAQLAPHLRISPAAARAQARAARAALGESAAPAFYQTLAPGDRAAVRNVLGLTLIVDFSDDVGTIAPTDVVNFCNQVGFNKWSNNGSVHDYYNDISLGQLNYTNYVPAAYYRAAHPKSYYTDPNISYGTRARELIVEALQALDAQGLDFTQFDSNGDGAIDALNCFYAGGRNNAWAQGLWPHASSVYWCADGKCTSRYQISDMSSGLTLSTFCHENGHMLMGWPDLYDYDYNSTGDGQWCIMSYPASSTNPQQPCAYLKDLAGWTSTTTLAAAQLHLALPSVGNKIYKIPRAGDPNQYFLVENRLKLARDAALPGSGLALWLIDRRGNNSYNERTTARHFLVTLVQADGRWDLEGNANYGDGSDLFRAPTYTACNPTTSPNTSWWSAGSTVSISNISASGAQMYFDFSPTVSLRGDLNCDGVIDFRDINPFVAALTDLAGWTAAYPGCSLLNADVNGDSAVDFRDINPLVTLLGG